MANKHGSLLATLGKRILGLSTSSSGCCAATGAEEKAVASKGAGEPTDADANVAGGRILEAKAQDSGCCIGSSCASATPAGASPKPSS